MVGANDPILDQYGDPLPKGAVVRLGTSRFWVDGVPLRIGFSADGKMVTAAGQVRVLRFWETSSGRLVRDYPKLAPAPESEATISAVALSSDGKYLAAGDSDGVIRIGSFASGERDRSFKTAGDERSNEIQALTFAGKNRYLVAGVLPSAIRVWDTAAQWRARDFLGHDGYVVALAASPDGKALASASWDKTIRIWDLATGRAIASFRPKAERQNLPTASLAYSSDGLWLAAAVDRDWIHLWNLKSGSEQSPLRDAGRGRHDIQFTPDGVSLASATGSTLALWDIVARQVLWRVRIAGFSVAVAPDGKTIALGGDEHITIVDRRSHVERPSIPHDGGVVALAWTPDGQKLVSAARSVRVWNAQSGQELGRYAYGSHKIVAIAHSHTGTMLALADDGAVIRTRDSTTGRELRALPTNQTRILSVAFTADDRGLVSSGADGTFRVLGTDTGNELLCIRHGAGGIPDFALSPDGNTLIAPHRSAIGLEVWDLHSGKVVRDYVGAGNKEESIFTAAISPRGDRVAGGGEGLLQIWESGSGRLLAKVPSHGTNPRAPVRRVRFSPNGRQIAWADDEGHVRLSDSTKGGIQEDWSGHLSAVTSLEFSPRGRALASGSIDQTALIWAMED